MIHYKLSDDNYGSLNVTVHRNQYSFGYPCDSSTGNCTSYTVDLPPGTYKFEVWGSSAKFGYGTPGLGGYSSGILIINESLSLYLFVGSNALFNALLYPPYIGVYPGASSDIRLNVSSNFEWFDAVSLRSRILVAAGGGSAEFKDSIGGNGGGLEGESGQSDCTNTGPICPEIIMNGGTQLQGGFASKVNKFGTYVKPGYDGLFGMSTNVNISNWGGIAGNGYWSGGSPAWAGAGGGGSSFVSGHEGCIALNSSENENPNPNNSSVHYA